jgi:hypothetical protein
MKSKRPLFLVSTVGELELGIPNSGPLSPPNIEIENLFLFFHYPILPIIHFVR